MKDQGFTTTARLHGRILMADSPRETSKRRPESTISRIWRLSLRCSSKPPMPGRPLRPSRYKEGEIRVLCRGLYHADELSSGVEDGGPAEPGKYTHVDSDAIAPKAGDVRGQVRDRSHHGSPASL